MLDHEPLADRKTQTGCITAGAEAGIEDLIDRIRRNPATRISNLHHGGDSASLTPTLDGNTDAATSWGMANGVTDEI